MSGCACEHAALAHRVAALEQQLAQVQLQLQAQRSTLTRRDRRLLIKLLPVIGAVHGSLPFTCRDLIDNDAPVALQLVLPHITAQRLGCLFRRADGQPVGGYVLQRQGVSNNVVTWAVLAAGT
jgi:hypothetical protein